MSRNLCHRPPTSKFISRSFTCCPLRALHHLHPLPRPISHILSRTTHISLIACILGSNRRPSISTPNSPAIRPLNHCHAFCSDNKAPRHNNRDPDSQEKDSFLGRRDRFRFGNLRPTPQILLHVTLFAAQSIHIASIFWPKRDVLRV